ncbi:MAG: fumarylacetoacetate hydrolase family protein [Actinomycetota bacterium]
MKLASLPTGRDGRLVVVSDDLTRMMPVRGTGSTLQAALDDWSIIEPELRTTAQSLASGKGEPFAEQECLAPLPRGLQWLDGSAYLHHVQLVRRARGADMPPSFFDDPLMYQGASDRFLAAHDPITASDEAWGIDLEAEVAVIIGDVRAGASVDEARTAIRLVMLVNDISLRNLIPAELAKGFGFVQSKPLTACSPVAVTPESLGKSWDGSRLYGRLHVQVNGAIIGRVNAGMGMQFDFPTLIAHAAKSRPLAAGTIIGSGTVANDEPGVGSSCIAEIRSLETVRDGKPTTPFLRHGDRVRIEMLNETGASIFGAIDQRVVVGTDV